MGNSSSFKKPILFIVVGLICFVLYLYFFVGFREIGSVIKEVNTVEYSLFYTIAIGCVFLNVLFYSITWAKLLKTVAVKISIRKSFVYCWLGSFVDLVVPLETVAAEITRVYFVSREAKDHFGGIVASVVIHRIITSLTVLIGLVSSSIFLILTYEVKQYVMQLLLFVIVGTASAIIFLLYLSVKGESKIEYFLIRISKIVERLGGKFLSGKNLTGKSQKGIRLFYDGVEIFKTKPFEILQSSFYTLLAWFSHMIVYHLVFLALGFKEIPLSVSIVIFSISTAFQTIPISPPVGLVEIVMSSLYNMFGIPLSTSGVATTLIRLITFWLKILFGYFLSQLIGMKELLSTNGANNDQE